MHSSLKDTYVLYIQKHSGTYTGAHKKVISEITIMASVRRGW